MINFIWSYAFTEGETNYDVYEEKTIIKDLDVTTTVPMFHVLTETLKTFAIIGARGDIWFLNDKDDKDELITMSFPDYFDYFQKLNTVNTTYKVKGSKEQFTDYDEDVLTKQQLFKWMAQNELIE